MVYGVFVLGMFVGWAVFAIALTVLKEDKKEGGRNGY